MVESVNNPIIQVKGLKKHYELTAGLIRDKVIGRVKALDGVDLSLGFCNILGIVGESGCGKSTLAKSILLLEKATAGKILFEGKDVAYLERDELKNYRHKVQAVFQNPFSSLSPRLKVESIIAEPLRVTCKLKKTEMKDRVGEALQMVGLLPSFMNAFPHELSGGQRQRVAIARAISTEAKIIILDEPTSALDVSIKLQIVDLLMNLHKKLSLSYMLIGHDLGIVAHMSTQIAVMYLGKVVEISETKELFNNSAHPYTRALISAVLPDHPRGKKGEFKLYGEIANPLHLPSGCRFHPRCQERKEICSEIEPPLRDVGNDHWVACHF